MIVFPCGTIDQSHEFSQGLAPVGITKIHFEFSVERFLISVFPWRTGTRARYRDAIALKHGDEYLRLVFPSVVRMEDCWPWMVEEGVCQDLYRDRRSLSCPHMKTPQLPREESDERETPMAFARADTFLSLLNAFFGTGTA